MESIIVALITGGLALVGVIFTNSQSSKRETEIQLITAQAVADAKIEMLEEKARKYDSFAERITALEVKAANLEERGKG